MVLFGQLVWLSDDAEEVGTMPLPTDGPPKFVGKRKSQLQAPFAGSRSAGTPLAHRGYALPHNKNILFGLIGDVPYPVLVSGVNLQ